MAEPAPTRRSSRTSFTPVQASSETLGASRAELRRRAAAAVDQIAAAPDAAPSTPVGPAPAPAAIELPAIDVPIVDAVAAATPLIAASVAAAATPMPPLSRRARRGVTAEQPAVEIPPIAPVAPAEVERAAAAFSADLPTAASPAPRIDAVLAPAEPFVLLEPVVEEPATADEQVEVLEVVADDAPAARPSRRQRAPRRVLVESEAVEPEVVAAEVVEREVVESEAAESATAESVTAKSDAAAESPADEESDPIDVQTASTEGEASGVDEFEAAARLFSFTGEVFVQVPADEERLEAGETAEAPASDEQPAPTHVASRKARAPRGAGFKRMAAASFSVGVMGIVGLMTVSMTTPAEAVAAASGTDVAMSIVAPGGTTVSEVDADEIQAYVAPAGVEPATLDRAGSYDTATTAELASQAGIQNFSNLFHNDPNAAIQWPFAVGVTMSYGFGMRSGRMHEGIDFTPGAGSPIQAIADGTVRVASEAGGAYGVHVIIDHMIDGQLVSSHYAHMQYGSLQVVPGQKVTVGTVLGRTGNTGRSYGAHTHFEILMNGTTPIDPMPWLREHAGG